MNRNKLAAAATAAAVTVGALTGPAAASWYSLEQTAPRATMHVDGYTHRGIERDCNVLIDRMRHASGDGWGADVFEVYPATSWDENRCDWEDSTFLGFTHNPFTGETGEQWHRFGDVRVGRGAHAGVFNTHLTWGRVRLRTTDGLCEERWFSMEDTTGTGFKFGDC